MLLSSSSIKGDLIKLREELKICYQKLADEQLVEWRLGFAQHLKSFLDHATGQLDTVLAQLHTTTKLFQRTLEILGEVVYPDNRTLEGEDQSALFLNTIAKVVSTLSSTKRDVEKNPLLLSDLKSPREEDDAGGGRRRSGLFASKSGRLSSSGLETPPPPPPPKRSVSESTPSPEPSPSSRGAMSPSPTLNSIVESSRALAPSPELSPEMASSPPTAPQPCSATDAANAKPTPAIKEKTKTDKATRPSRSKARIATL
jgi:hypothetical protein